MIPPVFVDTSGWVALFSRDDQAHGVAKRHWEILRKQRRLLLTSNYVLDETFTLLRRGRGGLPMAQTFHALIGQSQVLEVAWIDQGLSEQAWALFVSYSDKLFSFTDCTSFALMQARGIFEAFTFDEDFQRAGFVIQPADGT